MMYTWKNIYSFHKKKKNWFKFCKLRNNEIFLISLGYVIFLLKKKRGLIKIKNIKEIGHILSYEKTQLLNKVIVGL